MTLGNLRARLVAMLSSAVLAAAALVLTSPAQAQSVNFINTTSGGASGSGSFGMPTLNFNVAAGQNRIVFITAVFERDHCLTDTTDTSVTCAQHNTSSNSNFAAPGFVTSLGVNMQIQFAVSGPGGAIPVATNPLVPPNGDLRFGNVYTTPSPYTTADVNQTVYSQEAYFFALYESDLRTLLGGLPSGTITVTLPNVQQPQSAGDEGLLAGLQFNNVNQRKDGNTGTGIVRSMNDTSSTDCNTGVKFAAGQSAAGTWANCLNSYDAGQAPVNAGDGVLLFGFNGNEASGSGGFSTVAGFTQVANPRVSNTSPVGAHFLTGTESDGVSTSFQFRNGTPAPPFKMQSQNGAVTATTGGFSAGFTLTKTGLDLGITKTNSPTGTVDSATDTLVQGATTVYKVVVTNPTVNYADGAVVTDAAATGLTKTDVTCTATTGTATCPTSLTTGTPAQRVAALESGVAISNFPPNSALTISVTATVGSGVASVSNTATVAVPAGSTDTNPANNTATDTDPVLGRIVIIKDAQPDSSTQNFGFTTIGAGLSSFNLLDDGTTPAPGTSNYKQFDVTGSATPYTVTESATLGWTLTNVNCTAGGVPVNLLGIPTGVVGITVAAGQTVTCTFVNKHSPIVRLQKELPNGRYAIGDQFALTIGGSPAVTTTGSGTTATGTATLNPATAGTAITLSEAPAGGADLNNYTTTYSCSNATAGSATTLPSGSDTSFNTLTPAAGDDITCTFRNTLKGATLQVAKAWGASTVAGDKASIGATTGGANNTTSFTATAPTAANSGTAVTVAAGNTITFPAETMSPGTLANYNTVLACTANGGATANALSGTNGQAPNTLLIGAGDAGKAIVCTYTNTLKPITLQVAKAWGASAIAGDKASIGATTGGANNTTTFAATAPTAGNSGTAVNVVAGNTITLPAETMSPGTLANYSTVLACTANGGATANVLSGTNGQAPNTLLIGAGDAGKAIVCTYTNAPKSATLQLSKSWGANSIAGDKASIGATTGGANNTTSFAATAPTAANSGTAVTVTAGNTIMLPAETMSPGTLANYNTVLACTASGGATANTLSGTNGQVSNTLLIGASDAGKAIVCTYTNTPKTATLQLSKFWGANSIAGNVASIGATSGGASNTTSFVATAPTAGNSGAAVTVTAGNTITLPAETMTTGALANYTTVLSCSGATNAPSGTNGQAANTLLIDPADAGKAIVCTYTNTPKTATLQVAKAWGASAIAGDKASIGATTGGANNTTAFTATAPTGGNSGTAATVVAGNTITFPAETMPTGTLANYNTVLACTAGGGATANALSGTNGQATNTLVVGAGDAGKAIVCTYTNTPKTATLQLAKSWSANSISGNVASIGASTGGANNTTAFTATAPTAGNSGTAVNVVAGNTITLPAETMPTGSLASYSTVLSCTAGGGATANALSGTNGQASNTLLIGAADAGKAIVCTYTNTGKPPTLTIAKRSLGGVAGFDFTGTNGVAAHTITTTVAGTAVNGPVQTLTAASTATTVTETYTPATGVPDYVITDVSCTGMGSGGTVTRGTAQNKNQFTLDAAATAAGSNIVCTVTNAKAPTVQLRKNWVNALVNDAFTLSASGNVHPNHNIGYAFNLQATANTPNETDTAGAQRVAVGDTVTLSETPFGTNAGSYTASAWSCTGGGSLSGNLLTLGNADAGLPIVCEITNTAKTATVTLAKTWSGAIVNDAVSVTGTGLSTLASVANTAAETDTGTAQAVPVGSVINLAESFTTGSAANYTSALSCTGTSGLSGSTLTVGAADTAIVCTYANTRKTSAVTLSKSWSGAIAGDKVGLTIGGSAAEVTGATAGTSTAPATTTNATATAASGATVTLAEAFTTGLAANYTTTLACTKVSDGSTVTVSGSGLSRTFTMPSDSAVNCAYTNTRRTSTLQLSKAWGAGSTAGDVASIGASTGGASNTAAFTATAPTAGNSGTAVPVAAGDTLVFPAETMTTGTLANYTTVLSCTADGGATANAPSGTNGQTSNTLVIGAADAGKAIVCTYSNNRLPTVQIRKQALGGTGTFAFSGTNGFGSDSINVPVSGSTAVGAVKTLATANTQTVLTEVAASMPAGFAFSGASCTGLGGGATAAVDLVAGTVTLPAAGLTNGTAVVCTFTNTLAAIVSGRVFLDNGAGGGTANDGIVNGGEGPLSGVSVRLTNCGATVYASALTDASGSYSLGVPAGTATGSAMCVEETNPGTRVSTGASVGNVALPSGSAVAAAGGTYTYTRTGTPDRIAFSWNGTGHGNLNFGDVDNSTFATDGAKTGLPGNTVTYAHTFVAGTGGSVSFAIASSTSTPNLSGWAEKIFADPTCSGSLQPGAATLYPPSAPVSVVAGQTVCVVMQEFIPATAQPGYKNDAKVQAVLTLTNSMPAPALSATYTLDDITTVSTSALELKKEVRNVTQGVATFGVSNQAKSGETLEYRVTYTNNGTTAIGNLTVNDMTPAYTTFVSSATGATPATLTACQKTTPANPAPAPTVVCSAAQAAGGTGAVNWAFTGTLDPAGSGSVLFQVKVD